LCSELVQEYLKQTVAGRRGQQTGLKLHTHKGVGGMQRKFVMLTTASNGDKLQNQTPLSFWNA